MLQEYYNCWQRRETIKDNAVKDGKRIKHAPEHNDRKLSLLIAVEELEESSSKYDAKSLKQRIPDSIMVKNTISTINEKGVTIQQKEHIQKLDEHADDQRKKKYTSDKYKETFLNEDIENASKQKMDHDKVWQDKDPVSNLSKISTFSKMSHRKAIKVTNGLFEDIERAFP